MLASYISQRLNQSFSGFFLTKDPYTPILFSDFFYAILISHIHVLLFQTFLVNFKFFSE